MSSLTQSQLQFRRARTADVEDLERRIEKLTKINNALMQRVERSMDQQANAFSLFQTAIGLENQVRARTDELKSALRSSSAPTTS